MTKCIQIQWTCGTIEEARTIAHALIKKRLVACVNIIPSVESIYFWEGRIQTDEEVKVFLKTKASLFEEVRDYIEFHAEYDVPAIVAFSIEEGNPGYLTWLKETLATF